MNPSANNSSSPDTQSGSAAILLTPRSAVIIAIIVAVLAFIGTAVTFAGLNWAQTYWLFLVPIYGIFCTLIVMRRQNASGTLLGIQALHWFAVGLAIVIDFTYLHKTGEQTSQATGLSSLLILALGSFLAGIHFERLFTVLGGLLFGLVMVIALFQEYFGLALAIGLLATAGYFAATWFFQNDRTDKTPPK